MIAFLYLLDTENDRAKFTDLYNLYKDLLYWIAFEKVHNMEDAEECVQETFFYVARNFHKIDDIESKRTKCYLATIVTGFAIDIYKKSIRIDISPNDTYDIDLYDMQCFDSFDKIELAAVLERALEEESKVFIYLKYVYGYKSKEIAEIYNVKDSYVRKKLQYAKEELKKYLKEEA